MLVDLASRAATFLNLDSTMVFNAMQAREQLSSTGLGEGFALPHAPIGLHRRQTVHLVFLLQIPATAGGEHLAALAAISRHLRDRDFTARLRKATRGTALCHLLCDPQHS